MDIDKVHLYPRTDLHPDWIAVQLIAQQDGDVIHEIAFLPGTRFQIGSLLLEVIEEPMPGTPVMCKVVREGSATANIDLGLLASRESAIKLLQKYDAEPESRWDWFKRLWQWIGR